MISRISVKNLIGRVPEARFVGRSNKIDIALIKVDAKNLPVVELGDSDMLLVGDRVVAIGNLFGHSHTVTAGIVFAFGMQSPECSNR